MFTSTHHVVIDLETLALTPRAMVKSVGLAYFNPWGDEEIDTLTLHLRIDEQKGREIDPLTVAWWMRQSERARQSFAVEGCDSVDDLAYTLDRLYDDTVIWSKPIHFDLPILVDLLGDRFERGGGPLYRRRVHNARTIYEAASLLGERVDEDHEREGISRDELHHPAVDATLTAKTIRRALRMLRLR